MLYCYSRSSAAVCCYRLPFLDFVLHNTKTTTTPIYFYFIFRFSLVGSVSEANRKKLNNLHQTTAVATDAQEVPRHIFVGIFVRFFFLERNDRRKPVALQAIFKKKLQFPNSVPDFLYDITFIGSWNKISLFEFIGIWNIFGLLHIGTQQANVMNERYILRYRGKQKKKSLIGYDNFLSVSIEWFGYFSAQFGSISECVYSYPNGRRYVLLG